MQADTKRPPANHAFTLLEILVVVAVASVLLAILVPALATIKSGTDVTSAAYTISDALQLARSYAIGNNTYTWAGFFEESSVSPSIPATSGTGRAVLSIVASKDGTCIYDPNNPSTIDPTRLIQIGKLVKLDSIHLTTFPDGSGNGDTFATRPAALYATARIGDTTPPNPSKTPFQYPLAAATNPQYVFSKAVEFNPRGEARINNSNFTLKTVAEIGLRPTHGDNIDTNTPNVVAIQFSGVGANFTIYRP